MGYHKPDIESCPIQNQRMISEGLQKMSLQKLTNRPCPTTAGTIIPCHFMKNTGRQHDASMQKSAARQQKQHTEEQYLTSLIQSFFVSQVFILFHDSPL